MLAAVDEVGIDEPMRSVMVDYFVRASAHMINKDGKLMSQPAQSRPASERLIERIVHLSRLTRILLAAVFALALTLAITPLVDQHLPAIFFDSSTRVIPALISTAAGLVFYGVGWRLIIGYAGEAAAARPAILWYISIGAAACVVVVVLLVIGAITGTME